MAEANVVFQMFKSLSDKEKETFLRLLGMPTELTEIIDSIDTEEFLAKHRFPNQEVCCVHCGLLDVCKCGHTKSGHQRFRCKGCGKTFTYASRTIFNGAKKELDMYFQYIHCMMRGMTIRDSAKECHITKNNSFYLRHKILDALQKMQDKVRLDGIVEADDTYFPISFKGNHSKSKTFVMPREAHKRGERAKKRGISKEKVCVACAVNRSGKSIANISNLGRPSVASISAVLGGKITPDSILCTDKMNSYVPFAEHEGINVIQLKSNKRVDGMFNIQHINNYHSQLKKFMRIFNGVSTKYLPNYLVWNNLRNYAEGDTDFKESIWCKHNAEAVYDDSKWNYMDRPAIPLPLVA